MGERFRLLYLKSTDESSRIHDPKGDPRTTPLSAPVADTLLAQATSDLRHSDPKVRILALQFLERSEFSLAGPLLEEMAADPDPSVRAQALSLLIKFRKPDATPLLKRCLKDGDPWVRIAALRGLFEMDGGVDPHVLIQFLNDGSPFVRRKVATLLGWSRIEGGFPILMEMSRDQDAKVRKAALFSLFTSYPEEGEGRLVEAVADGDPDVRRWARETLEKRIGRAPKRHGG